MKRNPLTIGIGILLIIIAVHIVSGAVAGLINTPNEKKRIFILSLKKILAITIAAIVPVAG